MLTTCLSELPVKRIMLADTLGVLAPEEAESYVRLMTSRFDTPFDFHGHNDYGLAVSGIRQRAARRRRTHPRSHERAG